MEETEGCNDDEEQATGHGLRDGGEGTPVGGRYFLGEDEHSWQQVAHLRGLLFFGSQPSADSWDSLFPGIAPAEKKNITSS